MIHFSNRSGSQQSIQIIDGATISTNYVIRLMSQTVRTVSQSETIDEKASAPNRIPKSNLGSETAAPRPAQGLVKKPCNCSHSPKRSIQRSEGRVCFRIPKPC